MLMREVKFETWYSPEDGAWISRPIGNETLRRLSGLGDSPSEAIQECVVATSVALSLL